MLLLGWVLLDQGRLCADYTRQFALDSRQRLNAFLQTLPRGSIVLAEDYTRLGEFPSAGAPYHLVVVRFAADGGDLTRLERRRTNRVAVCELDHGRFFTPWSIAEPGRAAYFGRGRALYRALFALPPVWSYKPTHDMHAFTNPVVRVYRLPAAGPR